MNSKNIFIALMASYAVSGCVSNPSTGSSVSSNAPSFPEGSIIMQANSMAQADWVATRKTPWPANGTTAQYRLEVGYKKFRVGHGTPFQQIVSPYYHKAFKEICEGKGGKYMQRPLGSTQSIANCFKPNDYSTVYFAVDIKEEASTFVKGVWGQEVIVTEPTGSLKSETYLKAVHPNRSGPTEGY